MKLSSKVLRSQLIRLFLTLILLLVPASGKAQDDGISDEIILGLRYRASVLSKSAAIRGTSEDRIAQSIFSRLLNSTMGYAPPLPYSVTIIDDEAINAFVTPGGNVFVPLGMAKLLGDEKGLWAAVLGHELGHNIQRHHYRSYLRAEQRRRQIEYYRQRAAAGDSNANWALLGARIGAAIADTKLSRDDEHEADKVGLRMMVDAGFHPAFAITMYRRLRMKLGDESKFGAFFGTHPRWETREQRALKIYNDAVSEFDLKWPNAESSPGGFPPILANIGKVRTAEDKIGKEVRLEIPYTIRNGNRRTIFAIVLFTLNRNAVPGNLPDYRTKDGNLYAWAQIEPQTSLEQASVSISIPGAALALKDRKLKATIYLVRDGELLAESDELKVSFPKP
ncbi:MAG: M48 family metallopeptidase [Acidobacteriota bacterium]